MTSPSFQPAKTIAEVLYRLDEIIKASVAKGSRDSYFAVLYRNVTAKIKEGIEANDFADGQRMERLDVVFANRYLEAYFQYQNKQQPAASWLLAFQQAESRRPIIVQHLLLGINAHINLDLGIAAAEISKGKDLQNLKSDFIAINNILSEMLDIVQEKVAKVSLLLGILDNLGGRTDEMVVNFSIKVARDQAWRFAEELARSDAPDPAQLIANRDRETERIAQLVLKPGKLLQIMLFIIRIFEWHSIRKVTRTLR